MAQYAFAAPLLPGKTDHWKRAVAEMHGPRKAEVAASRRKAGLRHEAAWLQQTPHGDLVVVVWDTDDVKKAFHHFMTSTDPVDVWFKQAILVESHGMTGTEMPPINELVVDVRG